MAFDSIFDTLNSRLVSLFPVTVQLYPAVGGGPITLTGLISDPPLLEGYSAHSGSVVAELFFPSADLTTTPKNGDRLTVNGVSYSVSGDPRADVAGGITLDLRRNA